MNTYVPDETLFIFDVIPPREYVGAKAFRKDWDEFLGSTKGPLRYSITDMTVVVVSDVANGHSIQRMRSRAGAQPSSPRAQPLPRGGRWPCHLYPRKTQHWITIGAYASNWEETPDHRLPALGIPIPTSPEGR